MPNSYTKYKSDKPTEEVLVQLSQYVETTHNLKHLREEILKQLGKDVVSFDLRFDVGYYVLFSRINYVDSDNIKELCWFRDGGKTLWCEGRWYQTQCESMKSVVCLDDDDDNEPTPKKVKLQEKLNACEAKVKSRRDSH